LIVRTHHFFTIMSEILLEPLLRRLRLQRVISQIPSGAKVLDIGCGRSAALLNAIAPQISYGVGVDFKVSQFKRGNIETMSLKLDQSLPFPENSFDDVSLSD
jgi:ubiquinone/menaquinone biosynthesis C-methylase UbiE